MGKLWIATVIAILSTIPAVFNNTSFGTPIFNHIADTAAALSFPGMYLSQIAVLIFANFPIAATSRGFVFLVAVIGNTIFYWAFLSLFAALLTLLSGPSSRQAR